MLPSLVNIVDLSIIASLVQSGLFESYPHDEPSVTPT